MDSIWQPLLNNLPTALRNASSATLGWMVFGALILAVLLPVYLLMRALASRGLVANRGSTPQEDLAEALLKGTDLSQIRNSQSESGAEFAPTLEESQAGAVRRLFGFLPASVKISETVTVSEPTVVKMGNDEIRKAADLLRAGNDLDTVCRQVNPDYSGWGTLQQRLFRMTLEKVLKAEGGG